MTDLSVFKPILAHLLAFIDAEQEDILTGIDEGLYPNNRDNKDRLKELEAMHKEAKKLEAALAVKSHYTYHVTSTDIYETYITVEAFTEAEAEKLVHQDLEACPIDTRSGSFSNNDLDVSLENVKS